VRAQLHVSERRACAALGWHRCQSDGHNQKAAAFNYGAAWAKLAFLYLSGKGVGKSVPTAVENLEKAWSAGHLAAASTLSEIYRKGDGVTADREKALDWLQRGATAGDPLCHQQLAAMYERGEGVEASLERALFHHVIAIRQFQQQRYDPEHIKAALYRRASIARNMAVADVTKVLNQVANWKTGSLR